MSKLVDKERLAQLAKALDARMKAAVAAEAEIARAAEEAIEVKADANAAAIALINNEETGLLKQAKDYADGEVNKEKERAEEAEGALSDRIDLIDAKFEGGLDSFLEGLGEDTTIGGMIADISANKAKLDGIEEGKTVKAAIEAAVEVEKDRAEGKEAELAGKIAALDLAVNGGEGEGQDSIEEKIAAAQAAAEAKAAELDGALETKLQENIDAKVAQADYDVKVNNLEGRIAAFEGDASKEGSVKKQIADAVKAEEDRAKEVEEDHEGRIASNEAFVAAQPAIDKAQNDRLAVIEEMMGLGGVEGDKTALQELQESINAVEDKADQAQREVDAVEGRMDTAEGEIDQLQIDVARLDGAVDVEGSVKKQIKDAIDVVNGAAESLAGRVETLEGEMDTAEGRLDVVEDKLEGLEKDTVQASIDAAQADAEAKAAELDAALKLELQAEIDADVKVVADELANQMDVKVDGSLAKQIADEKARMDAFMADADVQQGAVDTLKELQSYINTHGEAAQKMVDDIAANKTAIETEAARAAKKEGEIEVALATAIEKEVKDRNDAIKVVTDAQATVNSGFEGRIAANEAFVAAQPAKDQAQDNKIKALEEAIGEGGSTAQAIAAAQKAAEDAQDAADAAQADVDAIEERLDVEGGLVDRLEAAEGAIKAEVETDRDAAIAAALEDYSTTEEMKQIIGNVVNSLALTMENDQVVLKLGGEEGIALASVSLDLATDAEIAAIIAGLDEVAGE